MKENTQKENIENLFLTSEDLIYIKKRKLLLLLINKIKKNPIKNKSKKEAIDRFADVTSNKIRKIMLQKSPRIYKIIKINYFIIKNLINKHKFNKKFSEDVISNINEESKCSFVPAVNERLRIAIKLDGGIGDCIIYSVWIKKFDEFICCNHSIDVYACQNKELSDGLFNGLQWINAVHIRNDSAINNNELYDIVINFRRFPFFKRINITKVKNNSWQLFELYKKYQYFYNKNLKFFSGPQIDNSIDYYTILQKKKRIQQPDIYGILGITEDILAEIPITQYESISDYNSTVLKQVLKSKYITVGSSQDLNYSSYDVRSYPFELMAEVLQEFKSKFPDIKIYQIGGKKTKKIPYCDFNLSGRTSFEELKIILKKSEVHVDNEGGLVHLRHHLGGRSVVLFGPTPIQFYSYSTDVAIRGSGCIGGCEWVTDSWHSECVRGDRFPPCMTSIKPHSVVEAIEKLL